MKSKSAARQIIDRDWNPPSDQQHQHLESISSAFFGGVDVGVYQCNVHVQRTFRNLGDMRMDAHIQAFTKHANGFALQTPYFDKHVNLFNDNLTFVQDRVRFHLPVTLWGVGHTVRPLIKTVGQQKTAFADIKNISHFFAIISNSTILHLLLHSTFQLSFTIIRKTLQCITICCNGPVFLHSHHKC